MNIISAFASGLAAWGFSVDSGAQNPSLNGIIVGCSVYISFILIDILNEIRAQKKQ